MMDPDAPKRDEDRPIRRRRRPAVACNECRRRKIACDKNLPCGHCARHKANCVFGTTENGPYPRAPKRAASPTTSATFPSEKRAHSPQVSRSHQRQSGSQYPGTSKEAPGLSVDNENDSSGSAEPEQMSRIFGVTAPRFKGRVSKTRLFGQSHWSNNMAEQIRDIHSVGFKVFLDPKSDLHVMLNQCKAMARALKTSQMEAVRAPESTDFSDFALSVPPKEVSDQLIDLYLRTFESVFRILHIPSFQKDCSQYWRDPSVSTEAFMAKFLLTMALGSCVYNGPDELRNSLRIAATRAIRRFDTWHCAALDKHRLTVDTIQIYCLVLLARQTSAVDLGDDLIWISAGSLLHMSFTMGLHRDPAFFHVLDFYQIELRRRLWATVLELVIQSSLDSGMPPLISPEDYDCSPPSNINDIDISENSHNLSVAVHPDTVFTQTSSQRILLRSLAIRLHITKTLNGLCTDQTYNETLRLSRELMESCRSSSALFESMARSGPESERRRPSLFQTKLINLLTCRFFHSLHSPFAKKSLTDIQYYYSRRIHLESALELISILAADPQTGDPRADGEEGLSLIQVAGRGLFKCIFVDTSQTVCFELIQQLRENLSPTGLGTTMSLSLKELYQAVQSVVSFGKRRIEGGETNVKSYVFYSGMLAQADAILAGRDVRESIAEAMRRSLHESYELLRSRAEIMGISIPKADVGGQKPTSSVAEETTDDVMSRELLSTSGTTVDFQSDSEQWNDFYAHTLGLGFDASDLWLGWGYDGRGDT